MPYRGPVYGKRTAARRIQTAWRRRRRRAAPRRRVVDRVKTYSDVRRAVQATGVSSVIVQETDLSLVTTPTVQQDISDIEYSNSDNRPDSRKSKKITVGHVSFRCRLDVGDRTNLCRVMFVRNKNPENAATFDASDIFNVNNGTGTQPVAMFAEPNLREVEVKYDRVFNLQDTTESVPATRPQSFYWRFSIPIRETFKYYQITNDTSEHTRNMKDYYLVAFSDSAILPNPSLKATSYTWFKNVMT